jgi:phosphoglycerol transferase MdoB-like AlkP superfamily enzyme
MQTIKYYYNIVKPYFITFISIEFLLRAIFLFNEYYKVEASFLEILLGLSISLIFDFFSVFIFLLLPITTIQLFIPSKFYNSKSYKILSILFFFLFCYALFFISISEYFFWEEFTSRFNFIAVDYLIYTREVIGNIKESYPVSFLLLLTGLISFLLTCFFYFSKIKRGSIPRPHFLIKLKVSLINLIIAITSFLFIKSDYIAIHDNEILNQINKNGIYEFCSAYVNNELSYEKYYLTYDDQKLLSLIRNDLNDKNNFLNNHDITRKITNKGPEHKYNVVILTVESLSAEYLKAFGNNENLTPNLDKIVDQSLFYKNLYAIGTRTVYGLAAITLSVPPVPGNSIIRRLNNENLLTIGEILNQKGYVSKFIYGGFGYFDNMNYFFANNGYEVIDRSQLKNEEISFANIWGVSDEDLFKKVIKENDKAYAAGKPFFDMVMTTSNHRPFTYPEGKIDIPSKTGRQGGVKYSDYAIGKFIDEAKTKPWFDNTIFVIVADHTAGSAGKIELDPHKYHIPLIIYAPKIIKPQQNEILASQIDIAPTILGILNMSYISKFFGQDLTKKQPNRALISNYQQLGYLTHENLLILKPIKQVIEYNRQGQEFQKIQHINDDLLHQTLAYFQNAAKWKTWNKK